MFMIAYIFFEYGSFPSLETNINPENNINA